MSKILLALAAVVLVTGMPLAAQRRPVAAARAPQAYWQPAVGIAGGYVSSYLPGNGGSFGTFSAPLIGSNSALALEGLATPPSLFGIVPLHGRWAVEPALDYHSFSGNNGAPKLSSILVSARADYAFDRVWYAAAGGQVSFFDGAGIGSQTRAGALVAVGGRFHLAGRVGGRAEFSYGFFGHSTDLMAQQNIAWLVGLTVPLR